MATTKIIKDRIGLSDGIRVLTAQEAHMCQAAHIPTFRGVLYEKDEFGNLLFVKSNTVVLGGSVNALEKLFGQFASYRPQSLSMQYKDKLTFASSIGEYTDVWERDHEDSSHICLFGVGTGGCALDISNVYDPDFRQKGLDGFIPFRVSNVPSLDTTGVLPGNDNATLRNKYHFRMPIAAGNDMMYGWYLKNFDNDPKITSLWKNAADISKDGTEITSEADVTNGPDGVGIETLGEMAISFTEDDIRDYFDKTGSTEVPRFNSIGLFTGTPVVVDSGYTEYYNVRLFSVVNFANVVRRIPTYASYVYRVYSSL